MELSNAIRRWWSKVKPHNTIEEGAGVQTLWPAPLVEQFALWRAAMEGTLEHNTLYPSQHTAAGVVSRVAKLALLELKTKVEGSAMGEFLHKELQNFVEKQPAGLRMATQEGLSGSRYLLYPFLRGKSIEVMVLGNDSYFPTAVDETGQLRGVVIPLSHEQEGMHYTLLVQLTHNPHESTYTMKYTAFESKSEGELGKKVSLGKVKHWGSLQEVTFTEVDAPWFIEYISPTGEAIFATALDTFRKIDKLEAQTEWEFDGAERAVFTPAGMFKDVGRKDPFHPEKSEIKLALPTGKERLYLQTNISPVDMHRPETYQPAIRDEEYRRRRNDLDREVENHCQLARGTISEVSHQAKTATEVEATRQVTYATVADIQQATQKVLEKLVQAMAEIAWRYGLAPKGAATLQIHWQDSIVASRAEEITERKIAGEEGWVTQEENRAWYRGERKELPQQATALQREEEK